MVQRQSEVVSPPLDPGRGGLVPGVALLETYSALDSVKKFAV